MGRGGCVARRALGSGARGPSEGPGGSSRDVAARAVRGLMPCRPWDRSRSSSSAVLSKRPMCMDFSKARRRRLGVTHSARSSRVLGIDVDQGRVRAEEHRPLVAGALVAQQRTGSPGQHRGPEAAEPAQLRMPEGVDTGIQGHKASSPQPVLDRARPQAQLQQLPQSYRSLLAREQCGDPGLNRGTCVT